MRPAWDLADHPGLQHLTEFLQMGLVVAVRLPQSGTDIGSGNRGPAIEIQAQQVVQLIPMPPG